MEALTILTPLMLLLSNPNETPFLRFPFFSTTAFAQGPCDALNLVSVGYSPFTDTVIVVSVENNNTTEIFDYPGFVLIDSNGDTVAQEIVNYTSKCAIKNLNYFLLR